MSDSNLRSTLLLSEDIIEIMTACEQIVKDEGADTSYVIPLMTHVFDIRTSTSFWYYQRNPYEFRLQALEKITGIEHSYKRHESYDALVIDSYLDWCISMGLIEEKGEIELFQPFESQNSSSDVVKSLIRDSDKVEWLDKYDWPDPNRGTLYNK